MSAENNSSRHSLLPLCPSSRLSENDVGRGRRQNFYGYRQGYVAVRQRLYHGRVLHEDLFRELQRAVYRRERRC